MNVARYRPRRWWRQPPPAAIEAACIIAALAAGLAWLALLPYEDIVRSALCFKFYAGHACAS